MGDGRDTPAPTPTIDSLRSQLLQRAAGEQEWQRLMKQAGNAVNYLAAEAIAWSQSHPQDPNVPQALHEVVQATRYGPADGKKSREYSKQAFDLLHRQYPKSPWTAQTPYWYR